MLNVLPLEELDVTARGEKNRAMNTSRILAPVMVTLFAASAAFAQTSSSSPSAASISSDSPKTATADVGGPHMDLRGENVYERRSQFETRSIERHSRQEINHGWALCCYGCLWQNADAGSGRKNEGDDIQGSGH